jgi:hypothetical protein
MSYENQARLIGDGPYRTRVRVCLLEEACKEGITPSWDAVFADIHNLEEQMVTRLAPLHAAQYDPALVVPSSKITDLDILAGVQAFWDEVVGGRG